jgi:tRNA 2-thiouridine synthesizing protein A
MAMVTETPVQVLDCRDVYCPTPVIRTSEAMGLLERGQVLELLTKDPGVEPDMQAWSRRTGHELLAIEVRDDVFHVFLRRAH